MLKRGLFYILSLLLLASSTASLCLHTHADARPEIAHAHHLLHGGGSDTADFFAPTSDAQHAHLSCAACAFEATFFSDAVPVRFSLLRTEFSLAPDSGLIDRLFALEKFSPTGSRGSPCSPRA